VIQKRLFLIAASLTVLLGIFNLSLANAATPSPSSTPKASGSASISPSASANPSATPSEDNSSPSPDVSRKPIGEPIRLWQSAWKGKSDTDPVILEAKVKKEKKTTKAQSSKSKKNSTTKIPTADYAAKQSLKGVFAGGDTLGSSINTCVQEQSKGKTISKWNDYFSSKGVVRTGDYSKEAAIIGKKKSKKGESYIISSPFNVVDEESSGDWQSLAVYYGVESGNAKPGFQVYARVSDDGSTTDPNDDGWVELTKVKAENAKCQSKAKIANYTIDQTGKTFQYKIALSTKQRIKLVYADVQPLGTDGDTEVSPSPEPSGSVSPKAGSGKVTIMSKILVPAKSATTPSPSTAPLLPQFTPSPKPTSTAAPSAPPKPNPACFKDDNTDPAASVPFSMRQTDGDVKIEDEQTDEDGIWHGINGGTDSFPAGTYSLKFGQFQDTDYKLVDICVSPNDGTYVRKTETAAGLSKATIIVKDGQETKVTLLYAPRDKPYITMNKFALAPNNKILRVVYPGLSFRYVIRYENTSDVPAKDVRIADVIPEQFYVQGSEEQTLDSTKKFDLTTDAIGRTTVVRKVGDLAKGQKGSFVIPVTLKADAFGSPDEIAGALNLANQVNQSQSDTGTDTSSAGSGTDNGTDASGSGSGDLELE
jgi:uncharacterized repeat protein (TIGR01451 family)